MAGLSHHATPIPLHGDQSNPRCTPQQYLCLAALKFVLWRDVVSQHAESTSPCMPWWAVVIRATLDALHNNICVWLRRSLCCGGMC